MLTLMIAGVSGLSGQETAYAQAASSEVYAAPVVRPYEPPSDFGRQVEEGDVNRPIRSRPITGPVAVEAYQGNYEQIRSSGEIGYVAAVNRARASADARMGSLDGVWTATGADGRPVLDLVLSDRGSSKPVEGALSLNDQTRSTAPVESVTRNGEETVIEASVGGRAVRLRLRQAGQGWTGSLSGLGRDQAVSLTRPG
ncbi:hypothetical protein [Brevundimonas goettingensis]|uniref:Uncharacterized protein n=1 Tax=Brevundimonas goettingensis TaxID=2774190 RepID=A0A975GUY5_9CAUL|nr:hypothetical protein [Brevundimonas goettingensis]QTC90791.1 hypothetical protein IFJ75_16375 [Brevundimonas goettingensis]